MASARLVAQAKVNLFLRVLAREASGYHQLETLFCRLSLGDRVVVRLTERDRSIDCAGPALPPLGLGPVEENLAWRAAEAFLTATGWRTGFAIELEKEIPVGGGLGGGSADAGAVLRALNALAPEPLSPHALLQLAAGLGADVPFLTQAVSPLALAWGRGERLLTLEALPERPCLLFAFRDGVATARAYGWLAASPAPAPPPLVYAAEHFATWSAVELMAYNEFERLVFPHHPVVRGVVEGLRHRELREALSVVLMSGSGATVFALPAPIEGETPDGALHLAIGINVEGPDADAVRVIETSTAAHVEPVVLDD